MKHLPALDGFRAIAILGVMVVHYSSVLPGPVHRVIQYGYVSVDLLIVLSGFLICGMLLDSRDREGFFRVFYSRRMLRILPAYFAFLLIYFLATRALHTPVRALWWQYALLIQNFGPDAGAWDGSMTHLWTVAVEFHFYLLWPLLIAFCPAKRLAWVLGAIALTALALRIALYDRVNDNLIYRATPFRMDALALGSLAAIALRSEPFSKWLHARKWWIFGGAAVAYATWFPVTERLTAVSYTAVAIIMAMTLFLGAGRANGLLTSRLFGRIGRYGYGIYLYHLAPHLMLHRFAERWPVVLRVVYIAGLMIASIGFGALSWKLIEEPCARIKKRIWYRSGKPVAAAA